MRRLPRIHQAQGLQPGRYELDVRGSQHIQQVLRMRLGDNLIVFDGLGHSYQGTLIECHRKKTVAELHEIEEPLLESPLQLHLGQAVTKKDKMEYALQKAVELGVTYITPVLTEFCDIKISEEILAKKHDRWQSIVISACEQCGRQIIPHLRAAVPLAEFINTLAAEPLRLVFHLATEQRLPVVEPAPKEVVALIGPEGGLSERDLQQLELAKFSLIQLGPRILRLETATTAALTLLQHTWGDLSQN